jgi:predicted transcriptional regulator
MEDKKAKPQILVEKIMTSQVHAVTPTMTVRDAIVMLTTNRISGAPVCDANQNVMSVVSEGNLLKLAASMGMDAKISLCLDKLPKLETLITSKKSETFTEVYKKFLTHSIHRIIVIDANGKLQGIVSRSNVLRVLVDPGKAAEGAEPAPTDKASSE